MLGRLRLLLALYLLVAFSIIWSTDRALTFRIGVYLFLHLIAAAYVSLRFDNEEIIGLVGNSMTILGLLSIPGQFLLPPDPYQVNSWKGVFQTKNGLGIAMAIGLSALLVSRKRWGAARIASILICLSLLVLSQSMTSILAAVASTAVIIYLRLRGHLSAVFLTAVIGAALLLSIAEPDLPGMFSSATGKDTNFTGRTAIWALVVQRIEERPILGYGYGAFWSTEAESVDQFLNGFKPGQAHSGYLEICLDLGILGLALCLTVITAVTIRAVRLNHYYGRRYGEWTLIIIALLMIHNVAESDFMLNGIMWFLFIITSFSSWKANNELGAEMISEVMNSSDEELVAV